MLVTNCCNFSIVEYLRGFEAFKETSFVVTDSHSFEWQKYGFKLHIPKGTVSAEHTECRVNIKVGLAGQFSIPDELQLVSCIYWLSCPQKFMKPVTLEIEHCASLQDSSQSSSLQFIVAKCSQAELPYQFRALEKGTFCTKKFLWQHSNLSVFILWDWYSQEIPVTSALLWCCILHSEGC